jgi:Pentatricopeptide repeat domain
MIPRRFRNGSSIALSALRCPNNKPLYHPHASKWLLHPSGWPRRTLPLHRNITNIATVDRDSTPTSSAKLKENSPSNARTPIKQESSSPTDLNTLFQDQLLLDRKSVDNSQTTENNAVASNSQQDQILLGQHLRQLIDQGQYQEAIQALLDNAAKHITAPLKISKTIYDHASKLPATDIIFVLQTVHPDSVHGKRSPIWRVTQQYINKLDFQTARDVFLSSKYTHVELEEMVQSHLVRRLVSHDGFDLNQMVQDIRDTVQVLKQRQRLCNVVLSRYLRIVNANGARIVLDSMQQHGISPSNVTYNILIHHELFVQDDPNTANALYEQLNRDATSATAALCNSFLKYHLSKQNWVEAERWLDIALEISTPKAINRFTSGILAYALASNPDSTSIASIAERMVTHPAFKDNIDDDAVYNSYLTFLLRHNRIGIATQLIQQYSHQLPRPLSICTCNLHLHAITMSGDIKEARTMLNKMIHGEDSYPQPDVISFATVINGYVLRNPDGVPDIDTANSMVKDMVNLGIKPNTVVHSILLQGLLTTDYSDISQARSLFNTIVEQQTSDTSQKQTVSMAILYNTMMNGYFIHYRMKNHNTIPREVYTLLRQGRRQKVPFTTSTLNIWVRGLAKMYGDIRSAESMFKVFEDMGVQANQRTMWYLIDTAVKKRRWDDAHRWVMYARDNDIPLTGHGLQRHLELVEDMMQRKAKQSWPYSLEQSKIDSID